MPNENPLTKEQALALCGQAAGTLTPEECAWLFDAARAVPPGGRWTEVGFGLQRSFWAVSLGLPAGGRFSWIVHPQEVPGIQPHRDELLAACQRAGDRLRAMRPDLDVHIVVGDPQHAPGPVGGELQDVIFFEASRDRNWTSGQIALWRPSLKSDGRLTGSGMGRLDWPGVTPAVAESLPGVSSGAGSIWIWSAAPAVECAAGMPRLSIVVATTGRPSVVKTLASIRAQRLLAGDEVLVVHDGAVGIQGIIAWDQARLPGRMLVLANGPHRDWGSAARTAGQAQARGSHLLWQDDDDVYLPGAFDVVRREIIATPDDILLFRLAYPSGRLLWKQPVVQCKNVSTQMYVIPRAAALGQWGTHYQGDFQFIETTVAANPARTVRFVDKPIVMYSRPL